MPESGFCPTLRKDIKKKEPMSQFSIRSSDPALLEKATRVAHEFAGQYTRDGIVGIAFLGAIARGYFDASADIDIAVFREKGSDISTPGQYFMREGLEIDCYLLDYESELAAAWDMPKRWTYSQAQVHYDPHGRIARLLAEKVRLRPEEKKELLMSGLTLSEWYINELTGLWVQRGDMVSAQHMFFQGVNYFFDMLFGLNEQLVADMKWRYYCVEKLKRLPSRFQERIQAIMLLRAFTVEELERRKAAFMEMWREMLPVIEAEVGMSFEEINALV
jgi:hypothetical protein